MSQTSVGPGPARGGNENHDNDPRNKTLGEHAPQGEPAAGADLLGAGAPELPAGVPGGPARPGAADAAAKSFPDGPNVEASPWELEAARGNPPKR